ncbi:hypothetical protein ACRTDJ_03025 [Shewanella algae]
MTQTEKLQAAIELLNGGKRTLRAIVEERKQISPDDKDPTGYHWLVNVRNLITSLIEDIQIEERQRIEKEIHALAALGGLDVQILTKEGKQLKSKSTVAKKLDRVVITTNNNTFIVTGARGRNKPEIKAILDAEGEKKRLAVGDSCPEIPNGVVTLEQYNQLLNYSM